MRRSVMLISMFAMVVSFVVWSMIAPIAPQLTKMYHLTVLQKSFLVATPVLLGSLLRIPLGMLTDRFGGRKTYTLLMLYLVIPLCGISFAHSFASLIFWEVLLGVAGTSFAVGIGHVSAWYTPEKQGLVLGITALGNIGTAVAGFSIPGLYLHFGFSTTARLLIIPVVLMAAILWIFTRNPVTSLAFAEKTKQTVQSPGIENGAPSVGKVAVHVWRNPNLWILAAYYFVTFGGFMAFGNYLPTLLQSQFALQPVDAGLRASGFVLLATVLRPIGGYLADRIRPTNLLVLTFAVITLSAVMFSYSMNNLVLSTIPALVIAVMLGIGNGAVFKLVPSYFPNATGKATGLIGAIGGIGGFFPPLVMGAIKEATGSYSYGMLLLAVVSAATFAMALIQNRRKTQNTQVHRNLHNPA